MHHVIVLVPFSLVCTCPWPVVSSSPILSGAIQIIGAIAVAVILVWAVRARRRSHGAYLAELAAAEVCPHLRPAYERLASGGHVAVNVGQRHPDLPLEIHMAPPFEPKALYDELNLGEPVFVSERNVLYCKEDLCEIRPVRG